MKSSGMHYTDTTEHMKGAMPRGSAAPERDCCKRRKTTVNGNKVKTGTKPAGAKREVG